MIRYRLGDLVEIVSEREDNPSSGKYDRFVGLEHFVSGDVEISDHSETDMLKSAMKVFRAGDILVARRNVYLRRASLVHFDGITSGDSIILRTKDALMNRLLPFVLNTDHFWSFAERFADGTMSKRLSPKVLLEYEFSLPEKAEQETLAELLWAANETKKAYKKLLSLTDEFVAAQFVEMFGEPFSNPRGWPKKTLGNSIIHANNGLTRRGSDAEGSIVLRLVELQDGFIDYRNPNRMTLSEAEQQRYLLQNNDFLFARVNGNPEYVGRCTYFTEIGAPVYHNDHIIRVRFEPEILHVEYLRWLLNSAYGKQQMRDKIKTSAGQYTINQEGISSIIVPVPPIQHQMRFADFVTRAGKSKSELEQASLALEVTVRTLIKQYVG